MPKLDESGPDKKGRGTGRGLGPCSKLNESEKRLRLGTGMGLARKKGCTEGKGKRIRSGE